SLNGSNGTEPLQIESMVGQSSAFREAVAKISLLAHCDFTVLLSGDTGTGKELFARAIHYHSPRKDRPFIPVNCGAMPDQLVENELFGHTKGAFTDASTSQGGLLSEAEGGTLFLDEIDTLSLSAQTKLLRFLQDREFRPLGSAKSKSANVRIIAATNTDLREQVNRRTFRGDLYHRLNILFLHLPPLVERLGDIPLLAMHFVCRYRSQCARENLHLSLGALLKLSAYTWP